MKPRTTFQPLKNLADGFQREIAQPEMRSPMALEIVPTPPAKLDDVEPFILNTYSIYFGMKVPNPMKAKT